MGRNPKYGEPMSAAERKAMSRANLIADVGIECSCIESLADVLTHAVRTGDTATALHAADAIKQHTKTIRARVK